MQQSSTPPVASSSFRTIFPNAFYADPFFSISELHFGYCNIEKFVLQNPAAHHHNLDAKYTFSILENPLCDRNSQFMILSYALARPHSAFKRFGSRAETRPTPFPLPVSTLFPHPEAHTFTLTHTHNVCLCTL